ncbi:MAG: hypothetical protein ACTXOO_01275 [Sodalis sp. (in: enterobacteria)]
MLFLLVTQGGITAVRRSVLIHISHGDSHIFARAVGGRAQVIWPPLRITHLPMEGWALICQLSEGRTVSLHQARLTAYLL